MLLPSEGRNIYYDIVGPENGSSPREIIADLDKL